MIQLLVTFNEEVQILSIVPQTVFSHLVSLRKYRSIQLLTRKQLFGKSDDFVKVFYHVTSARSFHLIIILCLVPSFWSHYTNHLMDDFINAFGAVDSNFEIMIKYDLSQWSEKMQGSMKVWVYFELE